MKQIHRIKLFAPGANRKKNLLCRLQKVFSLVLPFAAVVTFTACSDYGPAPEEDFETGGAADTITGKGLFIACEGNYMYGNSSLSYYDVEKQHVENEVFARANSQKLGDVACSMTLYNGLLWLVMNQSGVIFAVDPDTFREVGRIEGLTSPRYIHFLSDEKAYVTQLWDPRIYIVNPQTYAVTGYITTDMNPKSASTEQMVQVGDYVYTNCWSFQNRILKIDTKRDEVVAELEVGIQPAFLALDSHNKLWTLTDGGFMGSSYGYEAPALCRIDLENFTVEQRFVFELGDYVSGMAINGTRDRLYWLNGGVWSMDVTDEQLPEQPLIEQNGAMYYGLTVSPTSGEVYVSDAIDYTQNGMVLRYSPDGTLKDKFTVGVNPGIFCWK